MPGESHGQRSLVGYIVHRAAKSDTTERLSMCWGEGTVAKLIVKFTQVCKGTRITKKALQKTWLRGSATSYQDSTQESSVMMLGAVTSGV